MNKSISCIAIGIMLLLAHAEKSFSQSNMQLFKDTTTRMGSSITGALLEENKFIYTWGDGTGRVALKVPQLRKIDTSGNEVWSTAKSKLLTQGYISTIHTDSNFIYAIGIIPVEYQPSKFYLSKVNKGSGTVLFKKDMPGFNGYGIIDIRDKGTDSIRVVYYSYQGGQSNPNWPPVLFITIHKLNGNSSAAAPFGLSSMAPLLIDSSNMAYYYTAADSLIKYDVAQQTVVWRNKTFVQGSFVSRPPSNLKKQDNKVFLFGDRYCRQIDDNTGNTVWNIRMVSRLNQEFWPSDIVFNNDSIYTSWLHPFSGGNDDYGHFSKINKNNGAVYIDGAISNSGGISYDSAGYFKAYKIVMDSSGSFFLFGHYYNDNSGQRVVKKFSWFGSLLAETKLSVDSIVPHNNNVIEGNNFGYATGFLINNKPRFLYSKYIYTNASTELSSRVCFTTVSGDGSAKQEKFYDNNAFQYPSTVVDIKSCKGYTYVLKKQGFDVYVEKLFSADSLEWRTNITPHCFFTPVSFAIDSSGFICVIGNSQNCALISNTYTQTSRFPINTTLYLNPDGSILNRLAISPFTTTGGLPNLLGGSNGFYLVAEGGTTELDPFTYLNSNTNATANFTNGMYNSHSNKNFLAINDPDSVYIFSGRLSNFTDAFYYALSKQSFGERKNWLSTSFPQGYILHAIKSAKESTVAYVAGVTGSGSFPTIIKLNYKTNSVLWKYSGGQMGDAFKIVEDSAGYVYALLRTTQGTTVLKLNPATGATLWQDFKPEADANARSIDMDVNLTSQKLTYSGININGNYYRSYVCTLDAQTGAYLGNHVIQGDIAELNFVQAVESMQDSVTVIGGNLNSDQLDGKNGYLLFKGKSAATLPCTVNYWIGGINTFWETAGNWSCGTVPGPSSDVIINGGNVVVNSNAVINSLILATGVSLTISSGYNLTILH